ncbi:DinB family protein [Carboxydochorda subterranea]|uniref:DinB family protein n=1 Tax=Carboxydichorda subterranea TaxID=3109565 RepID=A0ABZ1BU89_9FIRM|nr:DinB family protein [Limnochorda sp. L945t]WRP16185.1 DinB family protein [Limnochorda sp. L945t]
MDENRPDAALARAYLPSLLDMTAERIREALAGLSDAELRARPQGLAPALWQIGHVALSDANLAARAGEAVALPEGYAALFSRGSTGDGELPPKEDVLRLFQEAHDRLLRLAGGDLDRPAVSPSGAYRTVGEGLVFMLYHRGYHHGKLMTLRALLGKPRLLG